MREVTVYTTEPCPYCSKAKGLLAAREIEYSEINLGKDPDGRAQLAEKTGLMTFPQIVIDGNTLGGWTELEAADRDGSLAALLGS
jgi:glutaredoxin 3